jgi:hypothetical protein
MKKLFFILFLVLPVVCFGQSVPIYAEFVSGLNINNIKFCTVKMQSMCQELLPELQNDKYDQKQMIDYAACMRQQMQNEKSCTQNLALLNKLKPNFVEIINIQHYPLFDAVETKLNKDDKQKWYFIVNSLGEFIDIREVYADMEYSTTYPYFIRKYPNATIGDVQPNFPPRFETLLLGDVRLVFAHYIVNNVNNCIINEFQSKIYVSSESNSQQSQGLRGEGPKLCEVIGTMESGYDFKRNGSFKWVKFVKLTPNEPSLLH